jgi:deoxycytidine triphosphate deaminase
MACMTAIRQRVLIAEPNKEVTMIISPLDILPLVREGRIIDGLSERELNKPEGIGFDLSLKEVHRLASGGGYLGTTRRNTVPVEPVDPNNEGVFSIHPAQCYIFTTVETFSLPPGIACLFHPRSTLFRSGVFLQNSSVPPGYVGPLNLSVHNASAHDFKIEKGARFLHAILFEVTGKSNEYAGQWQGGRVTTTKPEEQN